MGAKTFDRVIGQQITYVLEYLDPLAYTISHFLAPDGKAYICNEAVSTTTSQEEMMDTWTTALRKHNLEWVRISLDEFMPEAEASHRPPWSWMFEITHRATC